MISFVKWKHSGIHLFFSPPCDQNCFAPFYISFPPWKLQVCFIISLCVSLSRGFKLLDSDPCIVPRDEEKKSRNSQSFALISSASIRKNSVGSESLVRIKDKVDLLTSALPVCNAHLFHLRPVIPLPPITPLSGVARLNVIHSPVFSLWCSFSLSLTQSLFPSTSHPSSIPVDPV